MIETPEDLPGPVEGWSDRALWRRCRTADAPDDECARLLDLAAFAEGRVDADEHDRIAALLAADPEVAADVEAARVLAVAEPAAPAEIERIARRAVALLPAAPESGRIVMFPRREAPKSAERRAVLRIVAQWGSLAAGVALAGWLGFAMGSNTLSMLSENSYGINSSAQLELLDPGTGFLHDIGAGTQT